MSGILGSDAAIVDEDVYPIKGGNDLVDCGLDGGFIRYIAVAMDVSYICIFDLIEVPDPCSGPFQA